MSETRNLALRRRVAPFVPLSLVLEEPDGNIQVDLKLAFNMNAAAAVQEETGYLLTNTSIWNHIAEPKLLRAAVWAAALAHQPEYEADGGLATIGSYIQESNSEQIVEALWKAYLAYLPAAKRDFLIKAKADAEEKAKRGETNRPLDETQRPTSETIPSTGSNSGPSPEPTASAQTNSAG